MSIQRTVDSGIIQRGNTYRFTVAMGMNSSGKQIRKTTTWKPPNGITEKKADKLAKEEYVNFKNRCKGLSEFNENMRFKELSEQYFKIYASDKLKPITMYNYQQCVNHHFMDYFGNKKLKEINTGMITDFFHSVKKTDNEGNSVMMKPSTIKRIFTCLESIFTFAERQRFIKESPCKGVILPSESNQSDKEKRMYLTDEELPEFLSLFEEYSSFNTIIKVLLYTGIRSGECLGLQWSDIDFENRIISIKHTLTDVAGNHFLTTPKTKTSIRQIAMNDTVCSILKEHRTEQTKLQFAIGKSFQHPEMVFTSATGNYKDRSCLNTGLKRYLKGSKFDFMTLHCLRHSNATLLLNSGIDLKIVSEHLGHSDIGTTANIYADVLESSKRKTAELIEFKLKQAN